MNDDQIPTAVSSKQLQQIFKECYQKTRIVYNDLGFFTPRLRSINHLSIGRSRIISNPITIALELLYLLVIKVLDAIKALWKIISPKNLIAPVVAGKADSTLVGSTVFAGRADENTPIHHVQVMFWAQTWFFQWRKLSEGTTDREGHFELPFNLRAAKSWMIFRRTFEIYQTTYTYSGSPTKRYHYELFHSQRIAGSDLVGMRYDLRAIQLFFWEYRTDASVPRVVIKNHDKDAPQYYSEGRTNALNEQVIPIELTKLSHIEEINSDPRKITIEKIQSDYPPNLTVCMEHKLPGITRGDEWFGLRMMNGMYAATFVPDPSHPGRFLTRFYGACCYDINAEYAFPEAEISFEQSSEGIMMPVAIRLTGPLTRYDADPWQQHTFTPEDGDKWAQAKRIARVTGALSTEVDDHFTATHLVTEQFAIAAYRNLRLSPIAALLFPHLKEVILVNHSADGILIGTAKPPPPLSSIRDGGIILWLEDKIKTFFSDIAFETGSYIPQASALTHKGISERVRDLLGVQDWKDWRPMEPLSDAHKFPRAQQIFWDMLGEYVDAYIDRNLEDIQTHWYEIFRFSSDLLKHAVPLYLSNVDLDRLGPDERQLAKQRMAWYEQRYSIDTSAPRQTIDGELKVLTPITLSKDFNPDDLDNLKAACRYIIMMATFMHSFVNEHQYDDIGEILYNSLGLRFGDGKDGVMAPESDTRIAPDLTRSTQMMWFSNLLSRTEYGFIVRNEEGDINPKLVQMLKDRRKQMEENGMSIDNIESRTNI